MKSIKFFLLSLVVAIFGLLGGYLLSRTPNKTLITVVNTLPTVTPIGPTVTPIPQIATPKSLIIPRIGVSAQVESVAQDSQGRMDVPKNWDDVGWYDLGVKPGEIGNAVIDGHLDSPYTPAVFWNLGKLNVGDAIQVVAQDGNEYQFKVTKVESYPFDQLPLQAIFGRGDKKELNLITCEGVFDQSTKNYSRRIVIYSEETI